MTQTLPKLVTFEDFVAWRPEGGRYELHDGVIVEMPQPTGFPRIEFNRRTDFSSWRFSQ